MRKLLIMLVPVGLCMWAGMLSAVFSLVHRTDFGGAAAITAIDHEVFDFPGVAIHLAKLR